jgi:hypothetical protein
MGKMLMGKHNVNSSGGFPGFKMRMICMTFHCAEKYPLSKTALRKLGEIFYSNDSQFFKTFIIDEVITRGFLRI